MSAEHGVRIRAYGESPPVVVRQPQAPPTDLLPQKAILFNEIAERFTLPAIQPADNGEEQQLEDRNVDHERELISQSENTVRQAKIVEWDTTRVFAHDAVNRRRYRGGALGSGAVQAAGAGLSPEVQTVEARQDLGPVFEVRPARDLRAPRSDVQGVDAVDLRGRERIEPPVAGRYSPARVICSARRRPNVFAMPGMSRASDDTSWPRRRGVVLSRRIGANCSSNITTNDSLTAGSA
jgi:hypothetical protein